MTSVVTRNKSCGLGRIALTVFVLVAISPHVEAAGVEPAPSAFEIELEEATGTPRGPGVEGYVHNRRLYRIGNVLLRVEILDASGQRIGESFGWVLGNVPPGGRAYFFVPVSTRGATYRANVQSYDVLATGGP